MARYENPQVPHDVNVGKTSALGEFARLSLILIVFCITLVVTVYFGMRFAAPYIPFRYETSLAEGWAAKLDPEPPSATRQYLQSLIEALASDMDLPDEITLNVHVSDSKMPNAFATFGGHIIVTQGLLDLVDSENALSMVLAHEIGHIKHRDPIVAAGSGIVLSIAMSALLGSTDVAAVGNTSGVLTQLTFSRAQESAADEAALAALTQYYGHTHGAETFFRKMLTMSDNSDATSPEFLNTHPNTQKRLTRIETHYARTKDAELTLLPDFLMEERQSEKTCLE